jgi:hypothetical protein
LAPFASQRCHWYVKVVGFPSHVPFCAVSVSPTRGVPVMVGGAVFTGGAATAVAVRTRKAAQSAAVNVRMRLVLTVPPLEKYVYRVRKRRCCASRHGFLRTLTHSS